MSLTRHRAALIHLGLSAAIVGVALTAALAFWYPGAWFASMGGSDLMLILAGVDIVVGPTLTWIVYRAGKWGMKFDIAVIAGLQAAAFLYGMHVLFVARPAFMVLVVDQFRAVTAVELDSRALEQSPVPEFRNPPLAGGPRTVGTELPTDQGARSDLTLLIMATGLDLHQLPSYWRAYSGAEALGKARPLDELRAIDPANSPAIDAFLADRGRGADSLRFLPLRTRNKDMTTLVDAGNGAVVGIIDARPWR